jgi:hypothetical protein
VNFPVEGSEVPQAVKEPSSKFLGVSWHKPAKRWTASITELGKNKHLGYYPSEEQAARTYDDHAGPLGRKVSWAHTPRRHALGTGPSTHHASVPTQRSESTLAHR